MQEWLQAAGDLGGRGDVLRWGMELAVRSVLVLGLAWGTAAVLRHRAAALRHLVWATAFIGLLVLPVLSMVLPAWHLPRGVPATPSAVFVMPGSVSRASTGAVDRLLSAAPVDAAALLSVPGAPAGPWENGRPGSPQRGWPTPVPWLLAGWLGGLLLVFGRFGAGWLAARRLTRRARPVSAAAWQHELDEVRRRLRLRRRVCLLQSPFTAMPVTWGVWRPVVLLPDGAETWSAGRRHCVLVHELAHVRRFDCLTQALAGLACALYWFNPLVWIAAGRLRREQEQACDDVVLVAGTRPSSYAVHLVEIARAYRCLRPAPAGAAWMARPSRLETRIRAILDPRPGRVVRRRTGTLTVVAALLVLIPLAAFTPWENSAPGSPPATTADNYPVVRASEAPPAPERPVPPVAPVPPKTPAVPVSPVAPVLPAAPVSPAAPDEGKGFGHVGNPSPAAPPDPVRAPVKPNGIVGGERGRPVDSGTSAHGYAGPEPDRLRAFEAASKRLKAFDPDGSTWSEEEQERLEEELEAAMERLEEELEAAMERLEEELEAAFEAEVVDLGEIAVRVEAGVTEALAAERAYQVVRNLLNTPAGAYLSADDTAIPVLIRIAEEEPHTAAGQRALELLSRSDDERARRAVERLCPQEE
ncbi:M56 family metallopeptidase [Rhodocaloribacter litoris]|uniref:M56 family metallopeptidase n=1 Tax=Rhodocaloribacter litoris TaxID=2558931 RepID=UPI00141F362A|nr:M56 family metallopeptidase [Rhodocaloribacter litoris]QXD14682.1 M56 family metallopeptidase [Rhodocaloribacter litoris]